MVRDRAASPRPTRGGRRPRTPARTPTRSKDGCMAGKPQNRLELRRQYEAAEPLDPMEDESDDLAEEADDAEEGERKPKKKPKAPPKAKAKAKAAKPAKP